MKKHIRIIILLLIFITLVVIALLPFTVTIGDIAVLTIRYNVFTGCISGKTTINIFNGITKEDERCNVNPFEFINLKYKMLQKKQELRNFYEY